MKPRSVYLLGVKNPVTGERRMALFQTATDALLFQAVAQDAGAAIFQSAKLKVHHDVTEAFEELKPSLGELKPMTKKGTHRHEKD